MNIIYVTRDGIMEALGTSQVLAYMVKLSESYKISIISFEKKDDILDEEKLNRYKKIIRDNKINWVLFEYNKTLIKNILQFFNLFYTIYCLNKKESSLIHCRSFMGGVVGYIAKIFFGIYFIYDIRGFWVDERFDSLDKQKKGLIYKVLNIIDRNIYRKSDAVVSLTEAAKFELIRKGYKNDQSISVIPTCVDLNLFSGREFFARHIYQAEDKNLNIYYTGSVRGRQKFDIVLKLIKSIESFYNIKLIILNNGEHEYIKHLLKDYSINFELHDVEHRKVNEYLKQDGIAIFFYSKSYSRVATSPTKMGEFLAQGIPCITNSCVGDSQRILEGNGIGFTIDIDSNIDSMELSKKIDALLSDDNVARKCRSFAENYYSLDAGCLSYKKIYDDILGKFNCKF